MSWGSNARRRKPEPALAPEAGEAGAAPPRPTMRRWVIAVVCGGMAIGLGVVVAQASQLMLRDGETWRTQAEDQRERRLELGGRRGGLYDRSGAPLALSVDVPSASLDAVAMLEGVADEAREATALAQAGRLAEALGVDAGPVREGVLAEKRFLWLARGLSAEQAERLTALTSDTAGALRIRGVRVQPERRRFYPARELAAATLGFVSSDGAGREGVELALDETLRGAASEVEGLRDRRGRLLFPEGYSSPVVGGGDDVWLTLDVALQGVVERELALTAQMYQAAGASAVVVDPATGALLALASWPSYNPNDARTSEPDERRNRALSDRFEPGSTMKVFTLAAALEAGTTSPGASYFCENGRYRVGGHTIRDTHPQGTLDLAGVLAHSSNICAAKIGMALGEERLAEALARFGFGEATGVLLPGEASGLLRREGARWGTVRTATISFGQGLTVTNLQLAMATAALANGGVLMAPQLVERIVGEDGTLRRAFAPVTRRRAVSPAVARQLARLMVGVTTEEGTGTLAAIPGVQVAGKTGTAQKARVGARGYSEDYISAFIGFAPAEAPLVAMSVFVDSPQGEHIGGLVVAPLFRRIAEAALRLRGRRPEGVRVALPPDASPAPQPSDGRAPRDEQSASPPSPELGALVALPAVDGVPQAAGAGDTQPASVVAEPVSIPDFSGLPARTAVWQALRIGVSPRLQGTGIVRGQSPVAGSLLGAGETLTLLLAPAP